MLKYYGVFSTNKLGYTTPSIDTLGYYDKFALKNVYHYHNLSWKDRLGSMWKIAAGISYTNNKDDVSGSLQDASKKDVVLSGLEFKNFKLDVRGNYLNAKLVFDRRLRGLSALRFGMEYNFSNDPSSFIDNNNNRYTNIIKQHTNRWSRNIFRQSVI